jgi:hypothetical protein
MATVADLKTQLETALAALSTAVPVLDSGTLDSQRVERSSYRAMIRIAGVETATAGSNLTVTIATVELDLLHRAAGSTPTDLESAEDALALLVDDVAADSFWTALAAVRSSPVDVAVESDLERVGEVLRYTIRADCALEG